MKCNNRHCNAPWQMVWHKWIGRLLITLCCVSSASVVADTREQAKRMHDRLIGSPPTNLMLDEMVALMDGSEAGDIAAAKLAIDDVRNPTPVNSTPNAGFYNVTLKNFVAPWTNEAQSVFVPLNDYTATVIGIIRDDRDFQEVLTGDILYVGNGGLPIAAHSYSNNNHYVELERLGPVTGDLSDSSILVKTEQSNLPTSNLPTEATAGVMTTRAGAEAFYSGGTNRAMFRFTLMNHLCTDLEPLKDVTRVPDRVRRDVSRSPGGDSRLFLNQCVGCHAGMDGMAGAFAKYEYDKSNGELLYNDTANTSGLYEDSGNGVSEKHNINGNSFKYGYITTDDSWVNYWRNGQNSVLGWDSTVTLDENGHLNGSGAKELGTELANSTAFGSCQVKKAFKAICLRNSDDYAADRSKVQSIASAFMTAENYNMKNVFAKVAAYCKGP